MANTVEPFPDNPEEFLDDTRVSFNTASQRYLLEAEDGSEWEWVSNRWAKTMDDALLQQQAEVYKVAGVDDNESAVKPAKKRKQAEGNSKPAKEKPTRENTAIYVTSLPEGVTEGALADFFSKCGLIAESVDTNKPRIKLYYDDDGKFKGEALIVFFRAESVKLAVSLYDQYEYPTSRGNSAGPMHIFAADESYKKLKDDDPKEKKPAAPMKKARAPDNRNREMVKRKREQMEDRLNDWGEGDTSAVYGDRDRWEDRLVIIKHVFTSASIAQATADGEDDYLEAIYEDMEEEAKKFGPVSEIILYDLEDPGVVTIAFATSEAAEACIKVFDGRNYDGHKLQAATSDGTEVFRKSRPDAKRKSEEPLSQKPAKALKKNGQGPVTVEGKQLNESS